MKQKKKAKIYAVFCFAGKRFFFYIYDVITWEKLKKSSANHYFGVDILPRFCRSIGRSRWSGSIGASSFGGDTDWARDWFQAFRRWWSNTIDVKLTHALEGDVTQTFVILESCVLSDTVHSQVDRIDPVVKSRRRQEAYEPETGVWTVDKGKKVAWIPL
jgi:hypothetical protein